jgi:hypothetical protein
LGIVGHCSHALGDAIQLLARLLLPEDNARSVVSNWEPIMSERRKLQRNRAHLGATITFGDGRSTLDCIVRNLTVEGAMLATPNASHLPKLFDLTVPKKGQSFHGRTIWRDVERMGIAFVD